MVAEKWGSLPYLSGIYPSPPNLEETGQARKVGAVAPFGVTFGSLVEAGLGSFGGHRWHLVGRLGSVLCGRIDRSLPFGDLFGSLLATNSGQLGASVGLGWLSVGLLIRATLWGIDRQK